MEQPDGMQLLGFSIEPVSYDTSHILTPLALSAGGVRDGARDNLVGTKSRVYTGKPTSAGGMAAQPAFANPPELSVSPQPSHAYSLINGTESDAFTTDG